MKVSKSVCSTKIHWKLLTVPRTHLLTDDFRKPVQEEASPMENEQD